MRGQDSETRRRTQAWQASRSEEGKKFMYMEDAEDEEAMVLTKRLETDKPAEKPVGFGEIVVRLKIMVMNKLPFDMTIDDPIQVMMRAKMDREHHTVRFKVDEIYETLNL